MDTSINNCPDLNYDMAKFDILQYRILRELMGPLWMRRSKKFSYTELSKKVGQSPETSRRALYRMHKSGLIQTWNMTVNPHRLGMECVNILVKCDLEKEKAELAARLALVDGILRIFTFTDSSEVRVLLYYHDKVDLERKIGVIASLCGDSSEYSSSHVNFPPCIRNPRKIDWQIMKLLIQDPRVAIPELSEKLRVSSRTVRRRLAFLEEDNSYFIYPAFNTKKIDGFIYLFFLNFDNSENKRKAELSLLSEIKQIILFGTSSTNSTIMDVVCRNVGELDQIRAVTESKLGLTDMKIRSLYEVLSTSEWVVNELEKRAIKA